MFGLVYTNNIVYNAYSNLSENNLIRDSQVLADIGRVYNITAYFRFNDA